MNTLLLLFFMIEFSKTETRVLETHDKVFHGNLVDKIETFPYVIQLSFWDKFICGASCLNSKYVLTAAHCIFIPAFKFKITVGGLEVNKGIQNAFTKRVNVHPLFNVDILDYDVAVLELDKEIKFNEKVKPITLPKGPPKINSVVWIAGWRVFEKEAPVTRTREYLTYAIMRICELSKCANIADVTDRMICASYHQSVTDPTEGDSGCPLIVYKQNIQVGIGSWGKELLGTDENPLGYTNLAHPEIRSFVENFL